MEYVPCTVEDLALHESTMASSTVIYRASPQETILVNLANLEEFTYSNKEGETYRMRLWDAEDADALAAVYDSTYTNHEHCDKSIFEAETFRKDHDLINHYSYSFLGSDDKSAVPDLPLWFVVEKEEAPGQYSEAVGAFQINIHSNDLSGELARFAIKQEYQGHHIGGPAIKQLDRYAEQLGLEKVWADATSPVSFYALLKNGFAPEGVNVGEFVENLGNGEGHKRLNSMRVAKLTPSGLSKLDVDVTSFQLSLMVASAEFEENVRNSVGLSGHGAFADILTEFAARNPALLQDTEQENPRLTAYLDRLATSA